jgi:ubiquinone/menaquinone biosynthesis C-methylase UbiE
MKKNQIKKVVNKHYSNLAAGSSSCCNCSSDCAQDISKSIGYSEDDLKLSDANLGLGCGNPVALANIEKGDIVLDLGSGAGFDCFLASKKAGDTGKVYGVDFSKKMIKKARSNSKKYGYNNVEFLSGDIEKLPISENSIDIVISNCVINLAPNKEKVFREIKRVLKDNGKAYVSDIVLLADLSEEQKADETLLSGCVASALLKDEYIQIAESAGLKINVLSEDKDISKRQYDGIALESLKFELTKSNAH